MKKPSIALIKFCLAMLLFSISSNSWAEGEKAPVLEIQRVWKEKKISFALKKALHLTTVEIKDEQNHVLISNKIPKNGAFRKLYNLEKLASGQYKIEVNTGDRVIIQPLVLNQSRLFLNDLQRIEYFHPDIKVKNTDKFIDVRLKNANQDKIAIDLIDENNEVILNESFEETINRRYNLKGYRSNSYTIKVTTPYKTYYKKIVI